MSNNYGPRIVTDGLVLCLDAADKNSYAGSGSTWTDISVNSHNGQILNGPNYLNNNNGIFNFDGSNDFINVPGLSDILPLNNFTALGWFKANITAFKTLIAYSSGSQGWNLLIAPNRTLNCRTDTSNSPNQYPSDAGIFGDDTWRYAGVSGSVWNATGIKIKLFHQGEYKSQKNLNGQFNNTSGHNFRIMGPGLGTGYTAGSCALVQFYNRALLDSEILQNYQATKGRFGL
jgi:hypothetical protein